MKENFLANCRLLYLAREKKMLDGRNSELVGSIAVLKREKEVMRRELVQRERDMEELKKELDEMKIKSGEMRRVKDRDIDELKRKGVQTRKEVKKLMVEKILICKKNLELERIRNDIAKKLNEKERESKQRLLGFREERNLRKALENSFKIQDKITSKKNEEMTKKYEKERKKRKRNDKSAKEMKKKNEELTKRYEKERKNRKRNDKSAKEMKKIFEDGLVLEFVASGFARSRDKGLSEKRSLLEEIQDRNSRKVRQTNKKLQILNLELERLKAVEETGLCNICLTRKVEIIYRPCHHAITCKLCADKLRNCQNCRATINEKARVYL